MWTSTILEKQLSNGKLTVRVQFDSNSGAKATEMISGSTVEEIKNRVRARIDEFTKNEEALVQITEGLFDLTEAPSKLTQADLARMEWFNDYHKWSRVFELITQGVIAGDEVQVVALLNKVKTGFKPAYINYF